MHAPTEAKPKPTFQPHRLFKSSSPAHPKETPTKSAEGPSCAFPAPAGEVAAEGGRMGSSPTLNTSLPTLIDDLLNPSITTAELCRVPSFDSLSEGGQSATTPIPHNTPAPPPPSRSASMAGTILDP